VPRFLVFFVLASVLNTVGLIDADARRALADTALALITTALAGVGLSATSASCAAPGCAARARRNPLGDGRLGQPAAPEGDRAALSTVPAEMGCAFYWASNDGMSGHVC